MSRCGIRRKNRGRCAGVAPPTGGSRETPSRPGRRCGGRSRLARLGRCDRAVGRRGASPLRAPIQRARRPGLRPGRHRRLLPGAAARTPRPPRPRREAQRRHAVRARSRPTCSPPTSCRRHRRRRPDRRDRRRVRRPDGRGRPRRLPRQFGLPACTTANGCFRKVNQTGGDAATRARTPAGPRRSRSTSTWSRRSARTATSCWSRPTATRFANLGTAVNEAATLGANAICNSYGGWRRGRRDHGPYYNHPGIAVTA